ncbi:MAG: LCP family protein [bacterium]
MVRRKTDLDTHRIKVTRKTSSADGPEVAAPSSSRLMRSRRGGNARRIVFMVVLIALLLGVGWFTARAVMVGVDITKGGKGNFLTNLFNWRSAKLIGENEGRVNVLLLGQPGKGDGTVEGPDLTDTVIVASYNTTDNYLHLFSIPRDLYVQIEGYGSAKINSAYEIGASKLNDGPGTAMKTVGDLVGLDIPYYATIDFDGFKQVVDELGGVTVNVEKDLIDPTYPTANKGYETLEIKAGTYTMDGNLALKYVRSRKTTSDFDRAKRQQQVLLALRQKAFELDMLTAPGKIVAIGEIIKDHFSTNLTQKESERALQLLAGFDPARVTHKVFDDSPAGLLYGTKVDEIYVLKPVDDNYNGIKEFVTQAITQTSPEEPTQEEMSTEPLRIEVLNGTNVTGLAAKVAETIKAAAGFEVTRTGNNATRGFATTTIYSGGDDANTSAIRRLAELLSATVNDEKVTLPTGVGARVVVGESANK